MPIYFNPNTKEFHLQGGDISYIFTVLKNNQLGHLYFGKKIRQRDSFQHLLTMESRGMTACVFEGDSSFSLDTIKQEYPCYGTTDFREPAYHILQEDGSRITNFEYISHKIFTGKPKLDGLPATYVNSQDEATTLEIKLYDELIQVEITLLYTVFEKMNVITRSATFMNYGKEKVNLQRALSASMDFFDSNFEMIQLSGAWARERHMKTRRLAPGIQSISSTRGTSSSQHNPFIALKRSDTNEFQGEVYGFSLVYSGNFLAQVEVDSFDVARVTIGINPFDFNWLLNSGESFQTPEAVMVYSDHGLNSLSQTYHLLFRRNLARGIWRDKARPVLINNWEATYFKFNENKIMEIAKQAKELDIELFVLDDGWFGKRNNAKTSLGDWFVNKDKLPNGINGLARKITELGMEFGLWFEPEMISKESELYHQHPDWLIHVPNRRLSHGRNQFILDFSRKEVVDHLYKVIASILEEAPITYVKWDMNRNMTEIGSAVLPVERASEVAHRYILGVYELYERLTSAFPKVLFESCASGGARFDPGMLYYAPQTWTSDNTDAIERLKIQYGTSMVYPLSSIGAHVSAVPNHQVHRTTNIETRANVAFFGVFGYELDITKLTSAEKKDVKKQVAFYKKNRELILNGTFYRLLSPFEGEGNAISWMVVSKDQREAIAAYYQILNKPNACLQRIYFRGLKKDIRYKIEGQSATFYGDELMYAGLYIEKQKARKGETLDFQSRLFILKAVQ
ncbi:alpha-galactosidase [Bacillus sp. FJAT-49736]|uniref:alpha-galactosidase n=1 Tax=Bacillus sp. FJAT-49736 TaxID=2833582 RepID=UPI001BCA651B|nr:alpha-galactosidase [Bacillus sp. FJAT-49736]MBS4175131.1 alpha-galactosidase [Bacillus sp. FJAT-49736]